MADDREPLEQGNDQPKPDWNDRAYAWIAAQPLAALLLAGGGVAVLVVIYWAFRPDLAPAGAGFAYTVPQPGDAAVRTLWDWLDLLIVPLAVAAGAAFIGFVQKRTELEIAKKAREEDRKLAEKARETEQQIASDRLRQATLEGYYDRMTELLLEHDLRNSAEDSEARSIARARTVAAIKGVNGERNEQLVTFLKLSKLIEKDVPIVDLREADLRGTDLSGVDLREIDFRGTDFRRADLRGTNMIEANLRGADLREANLGQAVLGGANLTGAYLHKAILRKASLRDTNLSRAVLGEANLSRADLRMAYLHRAYLIGADLSDTDLSRADLVEAFLFMANLSRADLSGTNLSRSDLGRANLSGSSLSGACLSEVDLSGANLHWAYLRQADLRGVKNWTIDQFDSAKTLEGATMPDGVQLRDDDNPDRPTYDEWKAGK